MEVNKYDKNILKAKRVYINMDLWEELARIREENAEEIEKVEKKVLRGDYYEELPSFGQPAFVLSILREDNLENLMNTYQEHFGCEINTMEIQLTLSGWKVLLEYCIKENQTLQNITNKDIYRIRHRMDGCRTEGEVYNGPITYQKCWLYRRIINIFKRLLRKLSSR